MNLRAEQAAPLIPTLSRAYFRGRAWRDHFRRDSALPGFGLTLGVSLLQSWSRLAGERR